MASMPLALSVHNLVSSVGADAGFAAIVGLAILALLYFAHARETSVLREQAALLAERLQEAEARLQAAARAQASAQPVPAPPPASVGRPGPARTPPFAPVGLAGPALMSATRFLPLPPQGAPQPSGAALTAAASIKVSRVAGAPAAGAPAPAAVAPAAGAPEPGAPEPAAGSAPAAPPVEPVAVPAPEPSGPGHEPPASQPALPPSPPAPQPAERPAAPAPTPAAVTAFRTAPATVAGAVGPRPAGETANGSASGTSVADGESERELPPRPSRPPARPPERHVFVSSRTRRAPSAAGRRFAVLLGFIIAVGAVVAVIVATSGTGPQNPASSPGRTPAPVRPAFNPAKVTVSVLNGTNTNQLAHHVADRLATEGYKEGTIATASNQTLTSTTVGYLPGSANRSDALHVAKTLNLPTSSVAPIDQAAQAVACPPPGACKAEVVVTVGANLSAVY